MPGSWTVLMCPVCATTVDVEVFDSPNQERLTCTSCETEFWVWVDAAKVRAFGHVG